MLKYVSAILLAAVTLIQITSVESQLKHNKVFLTAKIKRTIAKEFSNSSSNARIVGGEVAIPNEFPFEVLVVGIQFIPLNLKVCAGSIVATQYILTAANCFYDENGNRYDENSYIWVAVAGAHDINSLTDSIPELYYVESIIIHPSYSFVTKNNDIALLKLVAPGVNYTSAIAKICLASGYVPPVGTNLEIAGWGRIDGQPEGSYNRLLHKTNVTVECDSFCEATNTAPAVYSTQTTFCAQNMGKSFCGGDEGGPAFVKVNETFFIQYGVISHQDGCGATNNPGFYTRVGAFKPWIEQETGCLPCLS